MRATHVQLQWIELKMATPMKVNSHQMGLPVDYKVDTGGIGVYFVVHCQDARSKTEYDTEVYRFFPAAIRPKLPRVRDFLDRRGR